MHNWCSFTHTSAPASLRPLMLRSARSVPVNTDIESATCQFFHSSTSRRRRRRRRRRCRCNLLGCATALGVTGSCCTAQAVQRVAWRCSFPPWRQALKHPLITNASNGAEVKLTKRFSQSISARESKGNEEVKGKWKEAFFLSCPLCVHTTTLVECCFQWERGPPAAAIASKKKKNERNFCCSQPAENFYKVTKRAVSFYYI